MSAKPPKYHHKKSYHEDDVNAVPHKGLDLDRDFNEVSDSLNQTIDRLGEIQNPDGTLGNRTVGREQLKPGIFADVGDDAKRAVEPLVQQAATSAAMADADAQRSLGAAVRAESARTVAEGVASGVGGVAAAAQRSAADAAVSASQAGREAFDARSSANYAATQAAGTQHSVEEAAKWAEYLAGPVVPWVGGAPVVPPGLPPESVPDGAGFYSARWWALESQRNIGAWGRYYLGPFAKEPATTGLAIGSVYFNSSATPPVGGWFVFNGATWQSMNAPVPVPGLVSGVQYTVSGGPRAVFQGADDNGAMPLADLPGVRYDVHLNGVRLADGDFSVASSVLTLVSPVPDGSVVQWDTVRTAHGSGIYMEISAAAYAAARKGPLSRATIEHTLDAAWGTFFPSEPPATDGDTVHVVGEGIYGRFNGHWIPMTGGAGITIVANDAARLALKAAPGEAAWQSDTSELWVWDGTTWGKVAPKFAPGANGDPLVYDQVSDSFFAAPLDPGNIDSFGSRESDVVQMVSGTARWSPMYTKGELDSRFTAITAGIQHGAAVIAITDTPPAAPDEGDRYIVDDSGVTGAFVGHEGEVALWELGAWVFTPPELNEAHLVESTNTLYHWNGTQWNLIGSVGTDTLDKLKDVNVIGKADNDILYWDNTSKTWVAKPPASTSVVHNIPIAVLKANLGTATDTLTALNADITGMIPAYTASKGDFIVVDSGAAGDARYNGVFAFDGTNWISFASAMGGRGSAGFLKTLAANPDHDLTAEPAPEASAQYTLEAQKHQIKVVDASGNWQEIYDEQRIRELIAASRAFKGTVVEQGASVTGTTPLDQLKAENTLSVSETGSYFVWVGTADHQIGATEIGGGPSNVVGVGLSSGDWIQVANLGTLAAPVMRYVVIHGDILSFSRALNVFGFRTWAAGPYESSTVVKYKPTPTSGWHYYQASTNVVPTDPAPGAAGNAVVSATPIAITVKVNTPAKDYTLIVTGGPVSSDGVFDITLDISSTSGSDTQTVSVSAGMTADQVADQIIADWSNTNTTATKGAAAEVQVAIKDVATDSITVIAPDKRTLANVNTGPGPNPWQEITPTANFGDALDAQGLKTASEGQVPVYDQASATWVPRSIVSPIVFLGGAPWVAADITDSAKKYGMAADTVPDPAKWAPQAGDQYIDLTTGDVTVFTSTGPATTGRTTANITGGTNVSDAIRNTLDELDDVDLTTNPPVDGQALIFDSATSTWMPKQIATTLAALTDVDSSGVTDGSSITYDASAALWRAGQLDAYSKQETDKKLASIVTGISHGASVNAIVNDPTTIADPQNLDLFIVGVSPQGLFAGHANEIAEYDGSTLSWNFTAPESGEAHLVESIDSIMHFSEGSGVNPAPSAGRWNKIATGSSGSTTQKNGVGEIIAWIGDTFDSSQYLECKGQVVAVSAYPDLHTVIGNKYNGTTADGISTFALPDLRGYFLRGVGARGAESTVGITQLDTTKMPHTPFTGTTGSAGSHTHTAGANEAGSHAHSVPINGAQTNWLSGGNPDSVLARRGGSTASGYSGTHTHNVTVNASGNHVHSVTIAGGDPETRPKNFSVKWLIRYAPIDGGARGPQGAPGIGIPAGAATDGQLLTYRGGAWTAETLSVSTGTAANDADALLKLDSSGHIPLGNIKTSTSTAANDANAIAKLDGNGKLLNSSLYAVNSSDGAPKAGYIPLLNSSGKLSSTFLPAANPPISGNIASTAAISAQSEPFTCAHSVEANNWHCFTLTFTRDVSAVIGGPGADCRGVEAVRVTPKIWKMFPTTADGNGTQAAFCFIAY